MKCYYEELCIERDATEGEIKSSYRKLALKWHPDKNPDCMLEAKERFQVIQQAYEVLSDPQERAWYDNHREQILRGKNSNYEDNCLDVFQYFTVSCFMGFGDDDKGFYSIYREVFEKISVEDAQFIKNEEELLSIPKFGDSKSSYEDIVGPFYAYWSSYCTKRTYTWLCPYDIKEVKERKLLREIDKEMKKVIQKAKKERNEEVRNLVSFVRKRDKRIQAYKKVLEERTALNRQKQEQNRIDQIRRRQKELEEMRQNSQITKANNDDYEERLKQLQQQYSSDEECFENEDALSEQKCLEDQKYVGDFYCVACSKEFKTDKSFANHEISRKHHDNVERLIVEMKRCEGFHQGENIPETKVIEKEEWEGEDEKEINSLNKEHHQANLTNNKSIKLKHKRGSKKVTYPILINFDEDVNDEIVEEVIQNLDLLDNIDKEDKEWDLTNRKSTRKFRNKNEAIKNKSLSFEHEHVKKKNESDYVSKTLRKSNSVLDSEINQHICATCNSKFESKNKLFTHLKLTNHGVFMPKTKLINESTKCKKGKGKNK